ncbi:unnamed protein product [Callosobruchus maculatus]|uniref:Major facilitator superfamily (MFS) profile domain-containing protein n=2 Tax=Callosobruchus maculatus TaxID=64391 RepID=A0A653DSS5_CALMS|nr:unnamed protein product [Callosobruchus maculatus]
MAGRDGESIFKGTSTQLLAVTAGTLAAISDGMQYGWTAPVNPILLSPDSPVKTTLHEAEWLETLLMIGSFSTLLITIFLVDRIGRKKSLLLSSFVTLVAWIVIAVAPSVEYLLVIRFFAGSAGNTCFVAAPMYIAEIADQKIRGFLSSIIYWMMLLGIFLIYGIAPFVPIWAHCIIGGGLVFLQLIIFPFMPESPYYLLYINKLEEAKRSLRWLRHKDANIEKEIEEIKCAVERQKKEKGRPQDLVLVPSNRKGITIMAILNLAQHYSGISVMLMNLHSILEAAGSVYMSASTTGIVFSLLMLVAATTVSVTIDKYGRKVLLITSSTLTGICQLVLAIYFSCKAAGYNLDTISWIPVVSVMLYALFFKSGLGMVPIVLTAELFPTKVKALGMTAADGFYVIGAITSLILYQQLSRNVGMQYPFYFFSAICFITAGFSHWFIPETKGKTLEEIQFILKGIKPGTEDIKEGKEQLVLLKDRNCDLG